MSSVFLRLNPVGLYPLYRILYPKRRIESYSILGTIVLFTDLGRSCARNVRHRWPQAKLLVLSTIVSPSKILLTCRSGGVSRLGVCFGRGGAVPIITAIIL